MTLSESGVSKTAEEDLFRALKGWRLWTSLGVLDVRHRYLHSRFGMLWHPLLTGIYIGVLSFIFSRLNDRHIAEFTLYLATGYIMWQYISEALIDATNVFRQSSRMMLNSIQPRSLFVFRGAAKHLTLLALNLTVLVAVYVLTMRPPPLTALYTLITMPVLIFATPGVVLLIGLLSLRFPDLKILTSFAMRLLFFATPIMWHPEKLGNAAWIADINPFYHALEIVRAPLTGSAPSLLSLGVTAGMGVLCWIAAYALYRHWYRSIIFWV